MSRLDEPKWPIKVLVIMRSTERDARTHGHPWSGTTPILCKFLLDAGFEVDLVNNLDRIKNQDPAEGLNAFDAVIFHGKLEHRDDDAVRSLKAFVEGGKGLVVVHIASASFAPDFNSISADWKNLIGSVWVYAPHDNPAHSSHPEPPGPISVTVDSPNHPVMAGIPSAFTLAKEELYQNMGIGEGGPGLALMSAKDERDEGGQIKVTSGPVAFALNRGKGRVFHTYLGHFISTHRDWRFQKMICQAVEWAAGK